MICNKASLYNNSKHVGVQVLSLSFIHGFLYKIFLPIVFPYSSRSDRVRAPSRNQILVHRWQCMAVRCLGTKNVIEIRNSRIVSLYLVSFSRPRAGKTSMVMALVALDQGYSWTTPSLNQSGVHSSFQSTRLRSRFPQFNVWSFLHRFGDATDLIWWSWTCPLFNLAFVLHSTRPGARTMLHIQNNFSVFFSVQPLRNSSKNFYVNFFAPSLVEYFFFKLAAWSCSLFSCPWWSWKVLTCQ